MANDAANDMELFLARSLFRADKWDPARDKEQPFEWEALRIAYMAKARRLLKTFEKDGVELAVASPAS